MSSHRAFPGYSSDSPLDLGGLSDAAFSGIMGRLADGSYRDFADAAARVNNCARPILLHGSSHTIDRHSGEVVASCSSD